MKKKIEENYKRKLRENPSSDSTSSETVETVWLAPSFGTRSPNDVVIEIQRHLTRQKTQGGNVAFLVDEVIDDKSREVAKKLRSELPDSFIWAAGPWPRDKPSKFQVGASL